MKDECGRDMARLRDTTVHGDKVIQAAPDLPHGHILVAPDAHLAECLGCGGAFPVIRWVHGPTGAHGSAMRLMEQVVARS